MRYNERWDAQLQAVTAGPIVSLLFSYINLRYYRVRRRRWEYRSGGPSLDRHHRAPWANRVSASHRKSSGQPLAHGIADAHDETQSLTFS